MKVYIVEFGEYSDRSVVGVFSTREAAEAFCRLAKKKEPFDDLVSDWELDEGVVSRARWVAVVDLSDGRARCAPYPTWADEPPAAHDGLPPYVAPYVSGGSAPTPEAAERAARDFRAKILAEREGAV